MSSAPGIGFDAAHVRFDADACVGVDLEGQSEDAPLGPGTGFDAHVHFDSDARACVNRISQGEDVSSSQPKRAEQHSSTPLFQPLLTKNDYNTLERSKERQRFENGWTVEWQRFWPQMAEDDDVFVFMGGDQEVPRRVRRARIHKSVKIIPRRAFRYCVDLTDVEFHDEIELIEEEAFKHCTSLRGPIRLLGVKIVKACAFKFCNDLTDVEFGDKLIAIDFAAFYSCVSLKTISMPSVKAIGVQAFAFCRQLSDVECGDGLETMVKGAFARCRCLRRIALPLKCNMIGPSVFHDCSQLATIDLVGGIHETVASLHLDSWRNEMTDEINLISEVLSNTTGGKTLTIHHWMKSVIRRLNHYRAEHNRILKEATTLLELALWKVNLDDKEGGVFEKEGVRRTRGSRKKARIAVCVTSGASVVIKNVLPFLCLKYVIGEGCPPVPMVIP